jgi:hypothetical protein
MRQEICLESMGMSEFDEAPQCYWAAAGFRNDRHGLAGDRFLVAQYDFTISLVMA